VYSSFPTSVRVPYVTDAVFGACSIINHARHSAHFRAYVNDDTLVCVTQVPATPRKALAAAGRPSSLPPGDASFLWKWDHSLEAVANLDRLTNLTS
jgi:hypothetical protein